MSSFLSRRKFLEKLGTTGTALAGIPLTSLGKRHPARSSTSLMKRSGKPGTLDNLHLALIGAGGMGRSDATTALQIPGVKLVAVCDLYDGYLEIAKTTWGNDLYTTRDYREILNRKDIDVVIVATHDHWHQQISIEAMKSGKHVYCEKPMVHSLAEGPAVIKAQKQTGKVFVVGSQLLSSLGYEKAKELLKQGAIGKLNYAEGVWARRTADGAWNYNIPEDASEETIDWDTFLKDKKKIPFDAERFFRWRKYRDYGTGMNGDLFVHIISGLHFVTDSFGPNKIYSSGGIRFWNDGREVPDVLIGTFDYPQTKTHPGFNLSLRCNFVDGSKGSYFYVWRLIGSDGEMEIQTNQVILRRNKILSGIDPNIILTEADVQVESRKQILAPEEIIYSAEKGYRGSHYDHHNYFFNAIRNSTPVVEDAVFGYRAAAPALACNDSYFNQEIIHWDPIKMKRIKK